MARTTSLFVCLAIFALAATVEAMPAPIPEVAPLPPDDPSQADSDDTVVCVYPISGTYGLFPRMVYYASLILAILGRYQQWLVLGALASALSYAGTAAIHLMMLVKSRESVFDLDILAAWAVVSTGCLAFAGLVHWSSTIQQSRSKFVLLLWGCLVGMGCIFGNAELKNMDTRALPACRSASGALFTSPSDMMHPQFSNCSYECFSTKKIMRDPSETIAIPTSILRGHDASLAAILFPAILTAAYKSISLNPDPHTPSKLCTAFVMVNINDSQNPRLSQHAYNAACTTWYGGYIILFHYIHKTKYVNAKKALIIAMLLYPWMLFELLIDLATPFIFVANIIVNEISLLKTNLPLEEGYHSVGQWGTVVSAVLVILAAFINKAIEMHENRKKPCKDVEGEDTELEASPGKPDPSSSSATSSSSSSSTTLSPSSAAGVQDSSNTATESVHVETVTSTPKAL